MIVVENARWIVSFMRIKNSSDDSCAWTCEVKRDLKHKSMYIYDVTPADLAKEQQVFQPGEGVRSD